MHELDRGGRAHGSFASDPCRRLFVCVCARLHCSSFNANSHSGRVINPYSFRNCRTAGDIKAVLADEGQLLSAGGSSGGSAAALAAHLCDGSETSATDGLLGVGAAMQLLRLRGMILKFIESHGSHSSAAHACLCHLST